MQGKAAFITGAASGIGLAFAERCAAEGMRLALADIDIAGLEAAVAPLRDRGGDVTCYRLDVSDLDQYRKVAAQVIEAYGAPFLLHNNAGVAWKAPASAATPEDWRWLVSVNVLGLGYGISLFVPSMIASGAGGHVVNTASVTGLIVSPGTSAVYSMTKHAVVAISETLAHELRPNGIHVCVVCPGSVATQIADADRNLPSGLNREELSTAEDAERTFTRQFVSMGLAPSEIADQTFQAMRDRRFYVVPHPEYRSEIETRHRQIENAVIGEPATDVALLEMAKSILNLQPLT